MPSKRGGPSSASIQSIDVDVSQTLHERLIDQDDDDDPVVFKEEESWLLSRLTFSWMSPLLALGYRRPLTVPDLGELPAPDRPDGVYRRFKRAWRRAGRGEFSSDRPAVSLPAIIWEMEKPALIAQAVAHLGYMLLSLVPPLVLCEMIYFVNKTQHEPLGTSFPYAADIMPFRDEWYYGYFLSGLMLVSLCTQSLLSQMRYNKGVRAGARTKTAIACAVFEQAMFMPASSSGEHSSGQVTNLMSQDAEKLSFKMAFFGNDLWISPLGIALALGLLGTFLGYAALFGFGVQLIIVPVARWLTAKQAGYRGRVLEQTDKRLKLVNELMSGIRVVKMYGWERVLTEQLDAVRAEELRLMRKRFFIQAASNLLLSSSSTIVALVTFAAYTVFGSRDLTAEQAFTAVALFNTIRDPLFAYPFVLNSVVDSGVSSRRIMGFITSRRLAARGKVARPVERLASMDEVSETSSVEGGGGGGGDMAPSADVSIEIIGGSFSWGGPAATLRNITVDVPRGSLTMVVGLVGSGKTSLLAAMLGEMDRLNGRQQLQGSVAYVAQTAWLMNETIRGNIIMNSPFIDAKYQRAVAATALLPDLRSLPAGDKTEVGERGVTVSGGQRQRVNLARAVYSGADVYLLDDPLSAVDAHVAKHIFQECIVGTLRNSTRVLATNQPNLFPHADQIVVMRDGEVAEVGTYDQLARPGTHFAELIGSMVEEDVHEEIEGRESVLTERAKSRAGEDDQAVLKAAEERDTGRVPFGIYTRYMTYAGGAIVALLFASLVLRQAFDVSSGYWLTYWTDRPRDNDGYYLSIYAVLAGLSVSFMVLSIVIMMLSGLAASRELHASMLRALVHTHVSFFDVTPIGRILNRFSSDQALVDELLPMSIANVLQNTFVLFGVMAVLAVASFWFFVACLPLALLYIFVQQYYRASSRELKRLSNISRSPLYAFFTECLNGLATIRAYRLTDAFMDRCKSLTGDSIVTYLFEMVANRWLAVRLEMLGAVLISGICLIGAVQRHDIEGGVLGLALAYSLTTTFSLNWLVRYVSDTEAQMGSVQRLGTFSSLEPEETTEEARQVAPPVHEWPSAGRVQFIDVVLKYRPHLPPVLDRVSLDIPGGARVGIVGRTGAGKSSLLQALFKMVPLTAGRVLIDDVDTSSVPLAELRSRVTIIPQEPLLFTGTVRFNLDPEARASDAQLWDALRKAQLGDVIADLDEMVVEGGANFSVGQRQLFCMGRALLRATRVLVLDEATSSIDAATDETLQRMIREEFEATTLTIAHRLNTIIDSDLILVLDRGRVAEFDSPETLLAAQGQFASMVQEAGL